MEYIEQFMEYTHDSTFCPYYIFYLGYIFLNFWIGNYYLSVGKKTAGGLMIAGALLLIAGLFIAPLSLIPLIWLLPLAIAGLAKAPAFQKYNLIYCSTIPVLLVLLNRHYNLLLN